MADVNVAVGDAIATQVSLSVIPISRAFFGFGAGDGGYAGG